MPRVKVEQGVLEGEVIQLVTNKGSYYSFKGIPYAAPPVGPLRFKDPEPAIPWSGVREAKQFSTNCPQVNPLTQQTIEGTEDCLHINVYSPNINPKVLAPVMFSIHCGAYIWGSGDDDLYGPDFLVENGVVLVTFNYRIGPFGFLCLDNPDVPGNAGMKDQVAALRWVKKNIEIFGGDPDNVTILGQSAGGSSVDFHLKSPMSRGLFKRAIMMSGSSECPWSKAFQPLDKAFQLGRKLGKFTHDPQDLLVYLRSLDAKEFINVSVPTNSKEVCEAAVTIHWNIADERDFGQERFYSSEFTTYSDIDVMAGFTTHEGLVFIVDLEKQAELLDSFPDYAVPCDLAWKCSEEQRKEIGDEIRQHYFGNINRITSAQAESIVKFYSSTQFVLPLIRSIKRLKAGTESKVFAYQFSCTSSRNVMNGRAKVACNLRECAAHGDELMYLFTSKLAPFDKDDESRKLIERTVTLWTNFAKFGHPTPDDSLAVVWPEYTLEWEQYLDIGNQLAVGHHLEKKEWQFWNRIYQKYLA